MSWKYRYVLGRIGQIVLIGARQLRPHLELPATAQPNIILTGTPSASASPSAVRPDRHCVVPEQPLGSPKPTGELHGPSGSGR